MKITRIAAGVTLGALSAALFATPAMADRDLSVGTFDRDMSVGTLDRDMSVGTNGTRVT
ncbi:hypothetical protein [Nonomuraea longispora]|uniref:hypothetical protein n=1 Tax=Nonomuraea longispora TaxID=1848320 RepID=UPI001404BE14|nr:hypothetical protein [Nonomuraea longispora]